MLRKFTSTKWNFFTRSIIQSSGLMLEYTCNFPCPDITSFFIIICHQDILSFKYKHVFKKNYHSVNADEFIKNSFEKRN